MTTSTLASPAASTATATTATRIAIVGTLFSLIWSSAFIAGKIGMQSSGPLTLLSLRFLLAGALLWLLSRCLQRPAATAPAARKAIWGALAAGLLTNAVYLGLTYTGMRTVPAGLTAILVSISPLLTSALAALCLREVVGWRGVLGLVAGLAGVVWIMGGRATGAPADPLGVVLILTGTVALAGATLLNRCAVRGVDPWQIAMIQLPASGLALLPLALWSEGMSIVPDVAFFGSLFYQAAVVSIGTTLMLLWLVKHGGVMRASGFHLLNPLFGTLLAATLLGEAVPLTDLLGAVPVMAGLALVLRPGR